MRAIVTRLCASSVDVQVRPWPGPTDTELLDQRGEQIALQFTAIGRSAAAAGQRRDRRPAVHVLVSRTRSSPAAPDSAEGLPDGAAVYPASAPHPQAAPPLTDAPFLPRTVLDRIGPPTSNKRRDTLVVENLPAAGLAVTELPRTIVPGWLQSVCEQGLPFDLTFVVRPIQAAVAQRFPRSAGDRPRFAQRSAPAAAASTTPPRTPRSRTPPTCALPIQRGQEAAVQGRHLQPDTRDVDQRAWRSGAACPRGLRPRRQSTPARTRFQQLQAFRSCLPQLTDELGDEHYLHTSGLAALLPWSAVQLTMPGGSCGPGSGGRAANPDQPVRQPAADGRQRGHLRPRPPGQSFLLKLIARPIPGGPRRRHPGRRGWSWRPGVSVVDAEASRSTARLCHDVGGQYIRLVQAAPSVSNPFDLPPFDPSDDDLRDPLRDHIASLERLLELLLAERGRMLTAERWPASNLALAGDLLGRVARRQRSNSPARFFPVIRTPIGPSARRSCATCSTSFATAARTFRHSNADLGAELATRLARYVEGSLADFFQPADQCRSDARLTVLQRLRPG